MTPFAIQAQHIARRIERILRCAVQRRAHASAAAAHQHHSDAISLLRQDVAETEAAIRWHTAQLQLATAKLRPLQQRENKSNDCGRPAGMRIGAALCALSALAVIGIVIHVASALMS